jgi:hypothetical protein
MRRKILGILIGTIFLLSIGAVAEPVLVNNKESKPTTLDDPVPTWSNGNSWTYTVDDFTVDYDDGSIKVLMDGRIDDFTWTVVDTSGSDYTVDFTGDLKADYFEIYLPTSSFTLDVTGSFIPALTSLSGTIVFTKTDLGIKDISAELKGIALAKIAPIPINLPLPFKLTVDGDLSTEIPIFDFPLSDNKYWALPNIIATMNLNIGGYFGLIQIPLTFYTEYPWIPLAFHCKPKAEVTVLAGTFDAYEIEQTFFNIFEYYYAPTVGNLIKFDAWMPNGEVHGELISYNYP